MKIYYSTTEEYYHALNAKFERGGYGDLKHPEMMQWLVNQDTASGIVADVDCIIDTLSGERKDAARSAFRSFRTLIRDIIRSANYPTISELPSPYIIMAIDDSYNTIMRIVKTDIKEENTMSNMDTIKEQMQAGINDCNNTISFDEFNTKAEKKNSIKITDGEEKIISSPRQNNIADLCNIVNIASTIALIIKSCHNKKTAGKYRVSDLACITLSSYITGQSIRETYQDFPNSKFGRLYHNSVRFAKKVVEAAKKLATKTTRKEGTDYEER